MRRKPFDIDQITQFPYVAFDTETTGLHWYRDKMFGIAVACYDPDEDLWMSDYWDVRDQPRILKPLARELARCRRLINHNIKFDAHFVFNETDDLLPNLECTQIRAALINEHERSYALDNLCAKKIDDRKHIEIYGKLAELFGGKPTRDTQMKNLHRAPVDMVREYAIPDPELAIKLYRWQESEIESQGLDPIVSLEHELLPVVFDMERHGVRVDEEYTHKSEAKIGRMIKQRTRDLMKLVDAGKFDEKLVNSPKQMRELFQPEERDGRWWVGDLVLQTTDAGAPSFDADALRLMAPRDERAKLILDLRKLTKGKQFLTNHILEHMVNGRVHANYNQTKNEHGGVGPGRFSITDPALQQIPKRDREIAAIVRSAFIPEEGHVWGCADWDQFEFRWFAHYARVPEIDEVYVADPDADFHGTAAEITGLPRNPRYAGDANAKQINLGLVFGMGEGRLAQEMGLPHEVKRRGDREFLVAGPEAETIFRKYHGAMPGIGTFLENASSVAKARGYVRTVMGRHIRFPGGQFTHKAGGLIFQGTSADCMKRKMIELHTVSKEMGFQLLLSVHDETDKSIPEPIKKQVAKRVKAILEDFSGDTGPIKCRIPIRSSVNLGKNWWEACK